STVPIAEIAYEVGVGNLSHFYALFKRHYAMTPRRYRLRSAGGPVQG
ncbi:MAG: AraC family transcriptional regulator, partial [Devosiaceae bacterium]|nr:AraC family transcriptional regulator [Devosiaceae bacterium MH13]